MSRCSVDVLTEVCWVQLCGRVPTSLWMQIVILGCQCEVVIKVKVLKSELRRRPSTVRTDIENNGNTYYPFILGHSIANIHSLLEVGAFSGFKAEEIDIEILFNAQKQDLDGMRFGI